MNDDDAAASFDLRRIAVGAFGPALFFGAAEGAVLPVIPETAVHQGATVAFAAFIAMLISFGSLLTNLPAAIVTDRFGERNALLGAGVVASAGCFIAILPHNAALIVGLLIFGSASSIYMLARQKYLTEAVPPSHRARAMSLLGGVTRIGVFIGPLAGSLVIHLWGTASAWLLAVGFLAVASICTLTMRDVEGTARVVAGERITARQVAHSHRMVLATVGLGVVFVSSIRASRQIVVPLWCQHIGLDAGQTSLIYAISAGIDMAVFYPAGKVMDVRGRAWVAVPSMLIMAISMAALPLTSALWSTLIASCVLGFGNGIGSGMVMTLGADFSPAAGRAAFLGLWRQLSDTGQTLGPLALSGLTALAGLSASIVVNAAAGLVAAGLLAYWPQKLEREGYGAHE